MIIKSVQKKRALQAAILCVALISSVSAFADGDDKNRVDQYLTDCQTLPLVTTLINGKPNNDVCVDAPVALTKAKVVFDMSSDQVDGLGRHTGLRHMFMLGTALKARINAGLLDPEDVSIIGVMHGAGLNLALTESSSKITKGIINSIFQLKEDGVNINLEVCGVTMHGKGLTNADLYSDKIHVNQGAIGRIIDLEQHRYALIKE